MMIYECFDTGRMNSLAFDELAKHKLKCSSQKSLPGPKATLLSDSTLLLQIYMTDNNFTRRP